MTTRKIKITGKNPPSNNNAGNGNNSNNNANGNNGKKRKSPRCHIVVSHKREGKYVESYRRPKGCAFVPQFPVPKAKYPKLPPPPQLPKPPTVTRLPLSVVRRLKNFHNLLERWSKYNYSGNLARELFEEILKEGKALGFLDEFGFMSNRTVASKLLGEVVKSAKRGKTGYILTEKEAKALIQRGMVNGRPVEGLDMFSVVRNKGIKPGDRIPLGFEVFQKMKEAGAVRPEELKDILDDAIKQSAKENDEYLKQIIKWSDETKKFADEAANVLKEYTDEVGKASGLKILTNALPYVFAALDVGIGLWEGEDPLRAFGGAASSFAGSVAAGAACTAAAIASGAATVGTGGISAPLAVSATIAVCSGIGGFAAGYTFDRVDETGVIRRVPKEIAMGLKKAFKKLPIPNQPSPTPTPAPNPSPSPTPAPAPSPSPAPTPTPKPKTLPQGIKVEGQREDGRPRYVSADGESVWVYKTGTADGGYWRGGKNKPTINPITGKPLEKGKKKDNQSPSPSPTPKPKPTPSPTPIPKPSPSPSPKPTPTPSPTPRPSPSPTPKPSPAPSATPGTANDGGTIPPNIVPPNVVQPNITNSPRPQPQPTQQPAQQQTSQPSQPRSDRPTDPQFTCVIKKDGTGYWRRKKGTPKDTPKPSTPCQAI